MKKYLVAAALILIACGIFLTVAVRRSPAKKDGLRSGVFDPPRDAPDFELDGSNGAKVHIHDLRGKVVILEFGFTYCQQVCPVTLANLVQVQKKLGASASDVQVVYVTVDPDRDTPQRLHEYLGVFNPSFLGVTGDEGTLDKVRESYGVMAERVVFPNDDAGYSHSSFIYLIDRQGRLRTLVPFGTPADDIAHDLELLLKS